MKIGELAKRCGVSIDTVRYYEKQSLLFPSSRSESGYRLFSQEAVERLNFVLRAKALGFTLSEIKELLAINVSPENYECSEVKQLAEDKLQDIEAKIKELETIYHALKNIADQCCGGQEPATECTILDALSRAERGV